MAALCHRSPRAHRSLLILVSTGRSPKRSVEHAACQGIQARLPVWPDRAPGRYVPRPSPSCPIELPLDSTDHETGRQACDRAQAGSIPSSAPPLGCSPCCTSPAVSSSGRPPWAAAGRCMRRRERNSTFSPDRPRYRGTIARAVRERHSSIDPREPWPSLEIGGCQLAGPAWDAGPGGTAPPCRTKSVRPRADSHPERRGLAWAAWREEARGRTRSVRGSLVGGQGSVPTHLTTPPTTGGASW
jgi:hypothetical protein